MRKKIQKVNNRAMILSLGGKPDQAAVMLRDSGSNQMESALEALSEKLVAHKLDTLEQVKAASDADFRSSVVVLLLIAGLAGLIGSVAAIWITLSIGRGLRRALALARRVAGAIFRGRPKCRAMTNWPNFWSPATPC